MGGSCNVQWKDAKLHISCELIDNVRERLGALTELKSGLGQTFLENWNCKAKLRIQSELDLEHFLMLNLLAGLKFSLSSTFYRTLLEKVNDKMKLQLLQVLKYDKNSWIVESMGSLKWISFCLDQPPSRRGMWNIPRSCWTFRVSWQLVLNIMSGAHLDWTLWRPWTSRMGIQKAGGPLFSWWCDT